MGLRVQWIQHLSDKVAGIPSEAMQQQLEAVTAKLQEWHMLKAVADTPLALFLMTGGQLEVCSSFYDQEHACVVHDPQAPPAPPVPPVPSSGTAATQPATQPEAGEAAHAPAAHVETGPPPLEEFLEDPAVLPDKESVATQLRLVEQRPRLRVPAGLVDGVDDVETVGDEWEDQNRGIENQLPTWQSTAIAVAMEPLQVSTRWTKLRDAAS